MRKKVHNVIMPAAVAIANGNPMGLIVVDGRKVYGSQRHEQTRGANQGDRRRSCCGVSDSDSSIGAG
jgi:hypothetical protein